MAIVAYPSSSWTSLGWVPCESSKMAQVWRRSWKQMSGGPACLSKGLKERLRRLEAYNLPCSTCLGRVYQSQFANSEVGVGLESVDPDPLNCTSHRKIRLWFRNTSIHRLTREYVNLRKFGCPRLRKRSS
jgi:hypothetical protein